MPPQRGVRMAVDALEPAAGMPSPPDMEESTIEPAMDVAESAQHTSPNKCLKRYDSVTDLRGKKVIDATGEASFEVNDGIDAARDASEVHGILTDLEMAVIQRNYQEDLARKQHRSRDIGDEGLDLEDRLAMEEAFLEPWSNESANDESDQMSGSGDEDQ